MPARFANQCPLCVSGDLAMGSRRRFGPSTSPGRLFWTIQRLLTRVLLFPPPRSRHSRSQPHRSFRTFARNAAPFSGSNGLGIGQVTCLAHSTYFPRCGCLLFLGAQPTDLPIHSDAQVLVIGYLDTISQHPTTITGCPDPFLLMNDCKNGECPFRGHA